MCYESQTGSVFILCPKFPEELKMLLVGNVRLSFALRVFLNEPDLPCSVQPGKAPDPGQPLPS